MFVRSERSVAVDFGLASSRLAGLAGGTGLTEASRALYQGSVEYLLRVGPAAKMPGMSRLVRVRFTEPVCREGSMSVGLRWEATGLTGRLFPALDADISLSDAGAAGTQVTLVGSYRPPFGAAGAELDRLVMRAVANATLRQLLTQVTLALEGVMTDQAAGPVAWQLEVSPETG